MSKTHPNKAEALKAVQAGEDSRSTAERLGIPWGTMRVWMSRWRSAGKLEPVTPAATPPVTVPDNVVALPRKPRKPEKAAERIEGWKNKRTAKRSRAIPPVDRSTLRRIARRLIVKLDTGLQCAICDEETAQPLTAQEFNLYTKAYVQQLDALARSLEVEGTLADEQGDKETDYSTPEGMAEIAQSLIQLGPRQLSAILQSDPQALKVVEAAVSDAIRRTG